MSYGKKHVKYEFHPSPVKKQASFLQKNTKPQYANEIKVQIFEK